MSATHTPADGAGDDPRPYDAVCIGCGYMLRGLGPGSACPECGLAVRRSLHPHSPWLDRAWLRQLRTGSLLLLAAEALLLAALTTGMSRRSDPFHVALRLSLPGALACVAVAQVLLTRRAPTATSRGTSHWLRRSMLFTAAVAGAAAFLRAPFALGGIGSTMALLLFMLALVCLAVSFAHLGGIASAMGEADLASAARAVSGSLTASIALAAMITSVLMLSGSGGLTPMALVVIMGCGGTIALVIAALIGLGVLFEMAFVAHDALR
jgi:hypothetical protein